MSYTKTFNGNKSQKTLQAWEATQEYLTDKQIRTLIDMSINLRHVQRAKPRAIYRRAQVVCGFVGVRGYYPVRAMAGFLMGKI